MPPLLGKVWMWVPGFSAPTFPADAQRAVLFRRCGQLPQGTAEIDRFQVRGFRLQLIGQARGAGPARHAQRRTAHRAKPTPRCGLRRHFIIGAVRRCRPHLTSMPSRAQTPLLVGRVFQQGPTGRHVGAVDQVDQHHPLRIAAQIHPQQQNSACSWRYFSLRRREPRSHRLGDVIPRVTSEAIWMDCQGRSVPWKRTTWAGWRGLVGLDRQIGLTVRRSNR